MKPERMIVGEKRILGFSIRWFHFVGNRIGDCYCFLLCSVWLPRNWKKVKMKKKSFF